MIRPLPRLLLTVALIALFAWLLGRAVDHEHAQASSAPADRTLRTGDTPTLQWAQGKGATQLAHNAAVQATICRVFGPECAKALRVAWCESRFNVYAVGNRYGRDPYYGLYQFGAYARRTYGFAWNALTQARAAKRMRDAEGWRPWPVCGHR